MLGKAAGNQALLEVKYKHTHTHSQTRNLASGPETEDSGLVQSSLKLLKVLLELKHPPIVMLGRLTARQRPYANPAGMGIIIDRILMHYLRVRLLLVKIII